MDVFRSAGERQPSTVKEDFVFIPSDAVLSTDVENVPRAGNFSFEYK
jgi:hypothetical protein